MLLRNKRKKGQSVLEYTSLVIILLASIFLFQKYVARGIYGRWKAAGDALSPGTGLYDPEKTLECAYDHEFGTGKWYDTSCFEDDVHDCASKCYTDLLVLSQCQACINQCAGTSEGVQCNQP